MLTTPQIVETQAQPAAVIHLAVAHSGMREVFGPAVRELMTVLAEQGVEPAGAVFAHHRRMPAGMFDFEVGVNVCGPVKAAGRVKPGQLPAVTAARAVHSGPYEGLASAWDAFNSWMKENGHVRAENFWEVYTVGPQSSPNPEDWRTELNSPLQR